jgi:stage III sporulation protein AE
MDNIFYELRDALMSGTASLSPTDILSEVFDLFTAEVRDCASMMAVIVILGALSGTVSVLASSEKSSGAAHSAFFACFAMMSAAAVKCFSLALGYALDTIHSMSEFITMLSPMLMALLMSSGQVASASAFHPILSAAVYTITVLTEKCIMPLVQLGAALSVVNNLSGRVQVSGFTSLIHSVTKWILTAVLTIFTGITAIYGFTTPVLDGISAKAVKFAVGSLVPVVGGLLSDAVETVAGSTRLMKNAVGTAGVAAICVMCIVPVLKLAAISLMLKLTYAMTEPVTDARISGLIKDIGKSVTTVLGMVITVAVLFIISVSIVLASTNIAM